MKGLKLQMHRHTHAYTQTLTHMLTYDCLSLHVSQGSGTEEKVCEKRQNLLGRFQRNDKVSTMDRNREFVQGSWSL